MIIEFEEKGGEKIKCTEELYIRMDNRRGRMPQGELNGDPLI